MLQSFDSCLRFAQYLGRLSYRKAAQESEDHHITLSRIYGRELPAEPFQGQLRVKSTVWFTARLAGSFGLFDRDRPAVGVFAVVIYK